MSTPEEKTTKATPEDQPTTEEKPKVEEAATEPAKPEEDPEAEVTSGNWVLPQVNIQEVEIKTGEEDEEEYWKCRAKLYRWRDNQWKERGLGDAKMLKNKEGKIRFLLRQEKTGKIVANHYIVAKETMCKLTPNAGNDKIWVWSVVDCAEEVPALEQFGLKFGTVENATKFKESFEAAVEENAKVLKEGKF